MFYETAPDPRWIVSLFLSLFTVLAVFFFVGIFDGETAPKWLKVTWGVGCIIVFAIMVKEDVFDAEIPEFLIVAYGPGTLLTWGIYWLSQTLVPTKNKDVP